MPSKKILEQKQTLVAELAQEIKNSISGVLVNYQGITVDDDTKMRKALREAGVKYKVVKNSLTGRACDEVGFSDMKQYLTGMTAIAISENDAVAPAKILKEYAEKIESFSILAGYVDGAVIDTKTVEALADIPSKEVLIAKFLGSIKSPVYGFAYAIKAVADKKAEGGAEEAPAAEAAEAPAAEAPAAEVAAEAPAAETAAE
ncbi:MAG: 50S ribosomal protein L10 [Clostridia bacterium]|nr:50S ribosomal protein L10 [Clostridia bacterium]